MNCEKIQELLMADYIDGEANIKLRAKIEKHLAACDNCSKMKEALIKEVLDPLKIAEKQSPQDFVWENIKDSIIKERQNAPERTGIRALKPAFAVPILAAVIIALILIAGLPMAQRGKIDSYMAEQIEFVETLDTDETGANGLGTAIEEYFFS